MNKKYLVGMIVWMFLFAGCSEGHRRHRGHSVVIRPTRPHCGLVRPSVRHRGPIIVIGRHPSYSSRKGSYGGRRGPYGQTKSKGHSKGHNKKR